jgi:hypothetical protein
MLELIISILCIQTSVSLHSYMQPAHRDADENLSVHRDTKVSLSRKSKIMHSNKKRTSAGSLSSAYAEPLEAITAKIKV